MLPDEFERGLKNYDSKLSLRWGNAAKCWIVERAGRVSKGEMDLLTLANKQPRPDPKAEEEYLSARNKKHIIFYVSTLDKRVFDALYQRDMRKNGEATIKRVLVDQPAQKEREKRSYSHELAREANSILHWMNRKHSTAILNGKADELVRSAFKPPKPPPPPPNRKPLLDAYGCPVQGV